MTGTRAEGDSPSALGSLFSPCIIKERAGKMYRPARITIYKVGGGERERVCVVHRGRRDVWVRYSSIMHNVPVHSRRCHPSALTCCAMCSYEEITQLRSAARKNYILDASNEKSCLESALRPISRFLSVSLCFGDYQRGFVSPVIQNSSVKLSRIHL